MLAPLNPAPTDLGPIPALQLSIEAGVCEYVFNRRQPKPRLWDFGGLVWEFRAQETQLLGFRVLGFFLVGV